MAKVTIAGARTTLGLTQRQFAEKLGVSEKTVWNWENGKRTVTPITLLAICSVTGFDKEDFILT